MLMPIEWEEPFPVVLPESMLCGTPLIAFRRGGVPEGIDHGRTGFLCDTVDEMTALVRRLPEIDRAMSGAKRSAASATPRSSPSTNADGVCSADPAGSGVAGLTVKQQFGRWRAHRRRGDGDQLDRAARSRRPAHAPSPGSGALGVGRRSSPAGPWINSTDRGRRGWPVIAGWRAPARALLGVEIGHWPARRRYRDIRRGLGVRRRIGRGRLRVARARASAPRRAAALPRATSPGRSMPGGVCRVVVPGRRAIVGWYLAHQREPARDSAASRAAIC